MKNRNREYMSLLTGEIGNLKYVIRHLIFRNCEGKLYFNLIWRAI